MHEHLFGNLRGLGCGEHCGWKFIEGCLKTHCGWLDVQGFERQFVMLFGETNIVFEGHCRGKFADSEWQESHGFGLHCGLFSMPTSGGQLCGLHSGGSDE